MMTRNTAPHTLPVAALLVGLLGGSACYAQKLPPLGLPSEGHIATVPVGGLAGGAQSDLASTIENPQASDVAQGRQLYWKLNCADCHGWDGKGNMGPDLADKSWIFGGTPAEIYKSIYEGRPDGMPAWGKALPPKDIWQLVAYIESLGGTVKPSQYQAARQGDKPGDLAAPELNFEQALDGSPPYPASMFAGAASAQTKSPTEQNTKTPQNSQK